MGQALRWSHGMASFSSRVRIMNVKSGGSKIGRKSLKHKVLRMKFSMSRNVPRPATYILHTFPASHGPYCETSENHRNLIQSEKYGNSPFIFSPISPLKGPIGSHLTSGHAGMARRILSRTAPTRHRALSTPFLASSIF